MQKYVDDEATIFKFIQGIPLEKTLLFTNSKDEEKICSIIKKSTLWINNSEDTNNPPDLYCDKYKIMGDIMKVDDSGHYVSNKKKRVYVNKEKEANSKAYKNLLNHEILSMFPNAENIFVIGDTSDIKTSEHHRFSWYVEEFQRIIGQHVNSIELYKKRFPNYKTIFFIYDESTPYIQIDSCLYSDKYINENFQKINKTIHLPFHDEEFLNVLKNKIELQDGSFAQIDYVVWCFPYKCFNATNGMNSDFPNLVIIDVKNIEKVKTLKYYYNRMISAEK